MKYTKHESSLLKETYYRGIHKSGLETIIIPKNQMTAYALFATRYGSSDSTFKKGDGEGFITVPDGIAHFLEHKLFENEDGSDTFSRFAELGASANAYTSTDMTAYLFSATENYYESLEVLLDFVTHPYFTPETVNKEMGIITEELRMYEDNPYRWLYQELQKLLYVNNTVRIPVGGTEESIREITADILYDCYNTFYNLHNMVLIVCGDVTTEGVEAVMDKVLHVSPDSKPERMRAEEPRCVKDSYSEKVFPISRPMFNIGLKETDFPDGGDLYIKREFEHSIICELSSASPRNFIRRTMPRA
ncbi:MAG: insulinase family protein [Clostridia bacterium]|nr:insulinase family protein [Clostridia bacterium]